MSVAFVPAPLCSCCAPSKNTRMHYLPSRIKSYRAKRIIVEVLHVTGLDVHSLLSRARGQAWVAQVRALIATRIRYETDLSLPAIGAILGRDHTSIIAMIKRTRGLLEWEADL